MAVYCVHLQELVQMCLCSAKWQNDKRVITAKDKEVYVTKLKI